MSDARGADPQAEADDAATDGGPNSSVFNADELEFEPTGDPLRDELLEMTLGDLEQLAGGTGERAEMARRILREPFEGFRGAVFGSYLGQADFSRRMSATMAGLNLPQAQIADALLRQGRGAVADAAAVGHSATPRLLATPKPRAGGRPYVRIPNHSQMQLQALETLAEQNGRLLENQNALLAVQEAQLQHQREAQAANAVEARRNFRWSRIAAIASVVAAVAGIVIMFL